MFFRKNMPQIEAVLRDVKEKLQIYRKKSGDFYEGGVEYTVLIKRIDAILDTITKQDEIRMSNFGNFKPRVSKTEVDATKPPPFYIGGPIGERK